MKGMIARTGVVDTVVQILSSPVLNDTIMEYVLLLLATLVHEGKFGRHV